MAMLRSLCFIMLLTSCIAFTLRFKRDFMYVADENSTDTDCYQTCNNKHTHDFEYSFNMSISDFYDFPFHPLVLSYSSFILYCKLADQKSSCYKDKCNDYAVDTAFSPSNFMCHFKRNQFSEVRTCLSEAEPITFLKCDHQCHEEVNKKRKTEENSQVFSSSNLDSYEAELDTLCSFQSCYITCMEPVVNEICSRSLAERSSSLIKDLVQWHANDIADWHVITGRESELPASCRQLDIRSEDPILQIITKA